jgi:hypothetical protein
VGGSGKRVGHAGDGSMGYRLDLQPEPNWPGLSAEAGHLHADTSAMTDVAKRLVAAAEQVEQIPDPLVGKVSRVNFGPQQWPAAAQLSWANGEVLKAVAEYTTAMAFTLREAARSISAAATKIIEAEQRNSTESRQVDSHLGGGSASAGDAGRPRSGGMNSDGIWVY